jgi:hypothetical protein
VYGLLYQEKEDPEGARERFVAALAICEQLGEGLYRQHIEAALAGLASDADPHTAQKG